jgi:hypothetical protein
MRLGDSHMKRLINNWPKFAFLFIPILIVAVDAAVLIDERTDSGAEKAVRLVRESRSRKENFTVQQYLYMTVYHRQNRGETINIEGWRAQQQSESGKRFVVSFSFVDNDKEQVAVWNVDLESKQITAANDDALSISWH